MAVTVELIVILLLVLANGVFALSEIAIVSSRKAKLQRQAQEGSPRARVALQLANDPGRFLATVQIGITLVGILAGTFGGATLSKQLAAAIARVPSLAPAADVLAVALVVLLITYLSLIIGELVPKRVGLSNPEGIAAAVARPMRALSQLARPAVWVLERSSDLVLRAVGFKAVAEEPVSQEEIKVLVEQGTAAGVFAPAEEQMVKGVFRLADRRVGTIMTPRPQIDWLDLTEPLEQLGRRISESPRSRFPVGRGSLDEIVGIAEAKTLLSSCLRGGMAMSENLLEKPLFVPESMLALTLLEQFKSATTHTAIVVDEYGAVAGLVTPYDIVQAVVGDFPGVNEPAEPWAVLRDDGSWLIDGMIPLDELHDLLHVPRLPGEQLGIYVTLAGYVVTHLGHLPVSSDSFELSGWRFEVVDMDGHRIDKVLVTLPPEELEPPE